MPFYVLSLHAAVDAHSRKQFECGSDRSKRFTACTATHPARVMLA